MAAEYKITKDKISQIADYKKAKKPFEFRYKLLKSVLKQCESAIMIIDTNASVAKNRQALDLALNDHCIEYKWFKIRSSNNKILGIFTNGFNKDKKEFPEQMILANVTYENFTKELFFNGLSNYDIALGIKSKLTTEKLAEEFREDIDLIFFDQEYFEDFVYDSILFTRFRTTLDIENLIEEIY